MPQKIKTENNKNTMDVCIVGADYVGLVTGA